MFDASHSYRLPILASAAVNVAAAAIAARVGKQAAPCT
jgi:hypothetical protein